MMISLGTPAQKYLIKSDDSPNTIPSPIITESKTGV